jgi:hypothetical protein
MKNIVLFVNTIILVTSGFLQAQQDTSSNKRYEIAIGFCKPLGTYQYAPQGNNVAYAQNGIYASVAAKSNINDFFGFKYSASVLINPAHDDIFSGVIVTGSTLSVKNWINSVFGIGTFFRIGSENSRLELGINLGMMALSRPKISYNEYVNGSLSGGDYSKNGIGYGFAIFPEIALVQKMSNGNELKFFINYYYAPSFVEYKKQNFFLDTTLNPHDFVWRVSNYSENLNVSVVNVGVGIIF